MALFAFLACLPSFAIELSLEENKAESGTVGYVDIEKVFKLYPLTKASKDKFKEKLEEKRKILQAKAAEIEEMKAKATRLKQEKEFAESLKNMIETAQKVSESIVIETSSVPSVLLEISSSSISQVTDSTSVAAQIESSTTTQVSDSTSAAVQIESSTAVYTPAISMPGVGSIPLSHFQFSVSTSPAEIEFALNSLNASILAAQESLRETRAKFDLEMSEYQEDETEKILGKIYIKLKEVSIKEGVSVVVDKKSILFGHKAVDLTDKVIKELKEDY